MHLRRERIRLETDRHVILGTLQLPNEGYRSRTTDFLTAHDTGFLALTDAEVSRLDASLPVERRDYVAVSTRHVVLVTEIESLGVFDENGERVG